MPGRCQVIETESRFKVIRGQGFGDGELLFNRSWVFNLKWYKSPGIGQGWCVYYEWASCSKVIRILSRWYVFSHKRVYPIPEDSLVQFTDIKTIHSEFIMNSYHAKPHGLKRHEEGGAGERAQCMLCKHKDPVRKLQHRLQFAWHVHPWV